MEIREISVDMLYTKSLPNYENLKLEAGVTVALAPGDSVEEAYDKAWKLARGQVRAQIPAKGAPPV
ncbi:hypothetical protein J4772_11300 [Cohnella sp. LGH]|uniref:hypothetical protein n=1 Tax=Cohnella sp. LGH TaxID=1619153 RepID=UPI001ADBBC32|nr:hypothetical protein [Cohnella sp. LGH]QTH44927.1 hypothetical protein J4772_11300 [Cohnella sp. LGH]